MKKLFYLSAIIFLALISPVQAQSIYVDADNGSDNATGKKEEPVSSLEKAMALARTFKSSQNITVKLMPGLYVLRDKLVIDKALENENWLTIEAAIMPDDTNWLPFKMPVIQPVTGNNSKNQFEHSVGFLIATNHVKIRGLKFLGNPKPEVRYYYPITREVESLNGLEVSQCYFVGEKNSAPIQGSIWAHGGGTHVDHCIFYGCKNALLLFKSIKDFSLTNSIIDGSYEAAIWYGPFDSDFEFKNNIVTNSAYFWLRAEKTFPKYVFNNSVITNNEQFMGYYTKSGSVRAEKNEHIENNVTKSGKVILSEVKTNGLPNDYLNPTEQSAGKDLGAGIFKKNR